MEHIGRLRDPHRFGAWIGTTARHECLAVLRGRKRVVPTADEIAQPLFAPHADADETSWPPSAGTRCGARWLAPAPSAELLRLLHSDSAPSYDEIGSALDMPVGSIGPTRGRALERLRRELQRAPRSAA